MVEQHEEDIRPNPDPTERTEQRLLREIGAVRELFETQLSGQNATFISKFDGVLARFEGNDKAIRLLQDIADKFPCRIDEKILALEKVHDQKFLALEKTSEEKFKGVQKQFEERDVRTDTSRVSDKTAVDAALAAQEKSFSKQGETFSDATAKTEQQFTKQMDQMRELHQTEIKGLQAQFNDLKDRFNRGEGRSEGTDKAVSHQQVQTGNNQWLIGIVIGVLIAAIGIVASVLMR